MIKKLIKRLIINTPLEGVARAVLRREARVEFKTSGSYWEERYLKGGTSGAGSYGRLAKFKANVLNEFVATNSVINVIEFGPGDGSQLSLASYPTYTGVDVSETAVVACREQFSQDQSKTFLTLQNYEGRRAELSLSLDVIYHLVEDEAFDTYMENLFDAAERFVIIYSSNKDEQAVAQHVRHRKFTDWVSTNAPTFSLAAQIPNQYPFNPDDQENTSFADFYVFQKSE
ncbi:hypothetical protein AB9F29_01640 [Falsihalocynthiibacter sp. S25ZX9]|uniref:hypothetical protein n=1 Tax=Falsihalocynthiibacter sp. S25ZX9 TaxID=3240870 RepID=UPI00351022BF